MSNGTEKKRIPRLAIVGVAYAVALALTFYYMPFDLRRWETLALAMFTAGAMLVFGPCPLVAGCDCAFLPSDGAWRTLLPLVKVYLAHVVFLVVISRRTTLWRRFGRHGGRVRHGAVAAMALASALGMWYELPTVEEYEVYCDADRLGGQEMRFAVVTDLHSCRYGEAQSALIDAVLSANVDAVLLVGDIFADRLDDGNAKTFISAMVANKPCIYVTGNHEFWSDHMDRNLRWLWKAGVVTLAGDCKRLVIKGTEVDFCGVDDPTYIYDEGWLEELDRACAQSDPARLRILLSHRPEYSWAFGARGFDLVVAGHLHGGQWRLPFLNAGLLGPQDQRFFPKYTSGIYALENGSQLAVSRGLARESTPLPRYGNHPELMIVSLKPANKKRKET